MKLPCLISLFLTFFSTQEAWACWCDEVKHRAASFNEAFDKAAVVFEGEVIQMKANFCSRP
jgi:hypothetical protein